MSPICGIVTDRDLVVRGLAETDDLTRTTVRDVMTRGPAAVEASLPVEHAVRVMADQKVRSAVVLDAEGALLGLLGLDDVVSFLVEEADEVARVIRPGGVVRSRVTSGVPR